LIGTCCLRFAALFGLAVMPSRLLAAAASGTHGDGLPSIEYRAQTGELVISPDGRAGIDSFIVESAAGYLDRANPTYPGPVLLSTSTRHEISANFFSPQVGVNNFVIGPVARRFLSSAQLLSDLTLRGGISGTPNFNFDLIVNAGPLHQWNNPAGGSWGSAGNWSSPFVPLGTVARFLGAISQPATITLDGNRGASMLIFDNPSAGYTIAQGAGSAGLALANSGRAVGVYVLSGAHSITAPVLFTEHTHFDLAGSLTFAHPATAPPGRSFTKSGAGALSFTGGLDLPASSSSLIVNAGTLSTAAITGSGAVELRGDAQVRILPGGSTSRLTNLVFDGDPGSLLAALDLADNHLVVQATSSTRQAILQRLTDLVGFARNSGNSGPWSGSGLASSAAAADPSGLMTLGVALNQDALGAPLFTAFNGIAVDENSVLVSFTRTGDADLDGRISPADFFAIDRGRALRLAGFQNGDFDYSGAVDAADYLLLDRAYLGQAHALSPDSPGFPPDPAPQLPEPASMLAGICILWVLVIPRRARRPTPA
jgi:hypothetical protein